MTVIVVLAMIFALLALRLFSVLGRRTGHEQQHQLPTPVEGSVAPRAQVPGQPDAGASGQRIAESAVAVPAQPGLRALIAADRSFDVGQFIGGARTAYGLILEAFWAGDRETLKRFCEVDVYEAFDGAIAQRDAEGHVLENKLVRIEAAHIVDARVEGNTAYVAVHFESDLSAITRDKDGTVVAGSMSDAVETVETWTFARDLRNPDPNWQLSETDEG